MGRPAQAPRQSSSKRRPTEAAAAGRAASSDVAEPPLASDPAFRLNDAEVERALITGEHAWELERCFGEADLGELRSLSRAASAQRRRGGRRVLILPGILGSKLGVAGRWLDDVYWLDPLDLAFSMERLRFGEVPGIQPLGVFLSVYLKLKLSLAIDGFDADFHPFDWRRGVRELGDELRARVDRETANGHEVSIVAHSMGGLVARSALRAGARIQRLVMLGTPNYGSFAPLLALRGVHPLVKRLALLDVARDAEELASQVLCTFPSLCELLPSPERCPAIDWFDRDAWPARGPAPDAKLLRAASRVQSALAPADDRHFLVAGVNQVTVVGARVDDGELVYSTSSAGDGTVPWELARLDGVKSWFVQAEHGALPDTGSVIRAVSELLDGGRTAALPDVMPPMPRAAPVSASEAQLTAREAFGGRRRTELAPADLRALLAGFAAPAPQKGRAADAALPAEGAPVVQATPFNRLTVGRISQQRLEIHLANASLTDVEARAYVLGLFREVKPSGAASVLDDYLGGAVGEFMRRRMFSGGVGEVFVMPANRRQLRTDLVIFAGLGYFDQFNDEVQRVAAQNVVRALVRTRVEEFATVLVGASTGADVAHLLMNLLSGFVEGKLQADSERRLSRIVLCETDPARYAEVRREVYRLASTSLFEDIEVTLTELEVAPAARLVVEPPRAAGEPGRAGAEPIYLLVREVAANSGTEYQSSVLGAGEKAAVFTSIQSPKPGEIDKALDELARKLSEQRLDLAQIDAFGRWLAECALGQEVPRILARMRERHLVVVHDAEASRLPWEALRIGDWSPALAQGISRRYMATNLSVAKYLESRLEDGRLDVLLVVNPTRDLAGAEREGRSLKQSLEKESGVRVQALRGSEATRRALLRAFGSGEFDVVHYAGHAFFDPMNRAQSGLLCHGHDVLTGNDLASAGNLPSLIVFNACESARVRSAGRVRAPGRAADLSANAGLAESLLRGGLANFVGTYWPVGDSPALEFAATFYAKLLEGVSVGSALVASRERVQAIGSADWADYVHYGDYDFRLRMR